MVEKKTPDELLKQKQREEAEKVLEEQRKRWADIIGKNTETPKTPEKKKKFGKAKMPEEIVAEFRQRKEKKQGGEAEPPQITQEDVQKDYLSEASDSPVFEDGTKVDLDVGSGLDSLPSTSSGEQTEEEKREAERLEKIARENDEMAAAENEEKGNIPETPEEKKVEKEIENLPTEEREKIGWGLGTIGLKVEKFKDNIFAKIFDKTLSKFDEKKGVGRFCKEMRDSFIRDAETATKKAQAKGFRKQCSDKLILTGNIVKYGRMLTDLTGASLASPLRYVMMAGMATARLAEAGKEARLKNEEVMEKTRIQDAEIAAEEAWKIYKKAQLREESENVSAEALKRSYMLEMPKDLQERLKNPSTANTFIQKILKKDIEGALRRLNTSIEKIENDSNLSNIETQAKIEKLIIKQKRNLEDYDRIITQYGTVDGLAMAGRYGQTIGKTVVAAVTVETLALSVEKMWTTLSNILSSHGEAHEAIATVHGGEKKLPQNIPPSASAHEAPSVSEAQPAPAEVKVAPALETPPPVETPPTETAPAATVVETPQEVAPAKIVQETPEAPQAVSSDAIVHKGEGIEHAFRRQIEHDPELAKKLGFTGDIKDAEALHKFSGGAAHRLAIEKGFVDNAGHEVRITEADKTAFEIKTAGNKVYVTEKSVEGKIFGSYDEGKYEFGENPLNPYDKEFTPPAQGVAPEVIPSTDHVVRLTPGEFEEFERMAKTPIVDKEISTEKWTPTAEELENQKLVDTMHTKAQVLEEISKGEFAKNPYHLTENKLLQTYETHQEIISRIFPKDTEIVWNDLVKETKAREILKIKESDATEKELTLFISYLRKLKEITGLSPKGGIFRRAETSGEYVVRALQKAASMGKLEIIKESVGR